MKSLLSLGVLLAMMVLIAGCRSREGLQASDVSYQYNTRELAPRPEFVVHHTLPEESVVHYRINSDDLLYMRNPEENNYQANFLLEYQLVESFEDGTILDSGLIAITDVAASPPHKAILGDFTIGTPTGSADGKYVLHLQMTDQNRQVEYTHFERINKSSKNTSGYFLLTDPDGQVIYKNHLPTSTPFKLHYSGRAVSQYYVSYYGRDFPLALPPYSSVDDQTFELKPDTTYMVPANQTIAFSNSGFYHFRVDTTQWQGFTVFSFYDQFPYIAKRAHLGPSLRYLTTKREYDELAKVMDDPAALKQEVDNFWLNRSGSVERSKILLEAYYNRVQEANLFFTSYQEGWKTDRGIIYVIYGPPDKVYRSTAGEAWIYGDENSSLSYYFNFSKVSNPFTDNDYALERLINYRYGWGQAIESWRNGHIYNSKDIQREQNEQEQSRYRQRPPYWY